MVLYILLTKYFCDIFEQNKTPDFDDIKDHIICVSFQNEGEKQDFLQNIDSKLLEYEEFDGIFLVLAENEVEFIMDNAPSNRLNFLRNSSNLSKN
ncbi:MAG: hypothetical protein RLZZ292_2528 [Bacteroidota bacterium]|jgi:hypothetical protein